MGCCASRASITVIVKICLDFHGLQIIPDGHYQWYGGDHESPRD